MRDASGKTSSSRTQVWIVACPLEKVWFGWWVFVTVPHCSALKCRRQRADGTDSNSHIERRLLDSMCCGSCCHALHPFRWQGLHAKTRGTPSPKGFNFWAMCACSCVLVTLFRFPAPHAHAHKHNKHGKQPASSACLPCGSRSLCSCVLATDDEQRAVACRGGGCGKSASYTRYCGGVCVGVSDAKHHHRRSQRAP